MSKKRRNILLAFIIPALLFYVVFQMCIRDRGGAYLLYGRYLQNKWGIDPKAKTPAYEMEDGVDYVPADTNVVFGHQFASIAGAGPINGPIQAAIFGWLLVVEYKQYKINMTIFNKYYMIVIEQGGEWLWQKVQNIHRSLKKMQ